MGILSISRKYVIKYKETLVHFFKSSYKSETGNNVIEEIETLYKIYVDLWENTPYMKRDEQVWLAAITLSIKRLLSRQRNIIRGRLCGECFF